MRRPPDCVHPSLVSSRPAAPGLVVLLLAATVATPGRAADPEPESVRPATWDMSQAELEAIGLGQSRGDPRPVPPEYPLRNVDRPAPGGHPAPWVIFVNFDGATLTQGADSAQNNVTQIGECAGEFAPYGAGDKRAAVMQATRADWAAYNIEVVDQRPSSGEYTMNMTGPTNPFGFGVLGIAPVDCGNFQTHSNITYAFHSVDDGFDAATTATTIGQEVAHSYGLEHVDQPADILNPTNAGGDPSFMDECLPIVGGALCTAQHELECPEGGAQNSHQELLTLFGPSIPDVDGPVVLVTAPLTGTIFSEGDGFNVVVTITDESEVIEADLYSNGQLVDTDTSAPWGWQISNVPGGIYALEVVARDEFENEGLSTPISILVEGGSVADSEGDEDPDDSGGGPQSGGDSGDGGDSDGETDSAGQAGDSDGCGCVQGRSGSPVLAGAPFLLLLLVSHRRDRSRAPRV